MRGFGCTPGPRRAAAADQLRAHLQAVLSAAAALFADVDSEITLAFLSRFTTQEQADWLSPQHTYS